VRAELVEAAPSERRRVAFFGGSFNPPHVGHVLGVVYALSTAPIDEVLVVPVYQHPFAKHLAPFEDRVAMLRAAFGWLPRVTISTIEEELGGESLTLRTVEHLVETRRDWAMRLLVGADVLGDVSKWHRWDRIAELAPPLVIERAGAASTDAHVAWVGHDDDAAPGERPPPLLPRVSSTAIRDAIAAGQVALARPLLPAGVLEHIVARRLYQEG
jgi:nicotinate-nucleotide adenylyltransferase